MSDENPSIVSHVSIGTRDLPKALVFYDAVMATVGAKRLEQIKQGDEQLLAVAYGKVYPEFWVQIPVNDKPATVGNGVHISFLASSQECVHRFHEVALKHGGSDNGAPGPRPQYGEPYYGCFIIDPDGNKIEANFWDFSLET